MATDTLSFAPASSMPTLKEVAHHQSWEISNAMALLSSMNLHTEQLTDQGADIGELHWKLERLGQMLQGKLEDIQQAFNPYI